jgi:predicted kinase
MGIPCSGKSTYIARTFPQPLDPDVEIFDEKKLPTLGRILRYLAAAMWEKKTLVVVEGVFNDARDRKKLIEWAYSNDYTPHCVVVDTALDICLDRNAALDKSLQVKPSVIKKASKEMKIPSTFDGFASVKREFGNGEEAIPTWIGS